MHLFLPVIDTDHPIRHTALGEFLWICCLSYHLEQPDDLSGSLPVRVRDFSQGHIGLFELVPSPHHLKMLKSHVFLANPMASCSRRILLLQSSFPSYLIDIVWSLHNLFMTIMTIMLMMMMMTTITITIQTCSDDISHITQSHIRILIFTKKISCCQFMIQIPLVPGHPNLLQSFRLRIGVRPLAISESSSPKPLKMMLL